MTFISFAALVLVGVGGGRRDVPAHASLAVRAYDRRDDTQCS
jgi:hypothetical protein